MNIDTYGTLVAAALVLIIGGKIVKWIPLLKNYTVPETVAGGIFAALIIYGLKEMGNVEINFDSSIREPLMLAFFATIGLNANLNKLKTGGRVLLVFCCAVIGLLFIQNIVGIGVATLLGLDPLMGLLGGSISLYGGHATGTAWAEIFAARYGFQNGLEMAMACATFGLVLGGLLGGPVSQYLLKRMPNLKVNEDDGVHLAYENPEHERAVSSLAIIESIAMVAVCLSLGTYVAGLLKGTIVELPSFVCALFIGVILSNTLAALGWYKVVERAISILGNVSLSLFLAIALMSLKLWELTSLALPVMVILLCQTIVMALYAIFVTFRVMGKNYDAAVLSAGHCGFGLGATPTAIANMQAVTEKYGPSHIAFLVVPMTAAFFLDIANAITIKLFLLLPMFPTALS